MQDSTAILNEISGALEALATDVVKVIPEDRSFLEIWGWNLPAIDRHQFAEEIRSPIDLIPEMTTKTLEDSDFELLSKMPSRIALIQSSSLPNLPSGNALYVYIVIRSLIDGIERVLGRYVQKQIGWKEIEDRKLVPAAQFRRLKKLESVLDELIEANADISDKIALINNAHQAAETLPADLDMLSEAKREYTGAMKDIETSLAKATAAKDSVDRILQEITASKNEATQLVKNTEAAFSAATTQGLGKAFGDRAVALGRSTWILGGFLVLTLGAAAYMSSKRIDFIHELMLSPNVSMQLLWVNVTLAIVSIAGPIWLAWILTKQIGQRFRLAEDYAFKASVAKAYEGYRNEAARVDPESEQRLFRSILDRLEEAPLRHVETDNHGSPWHELLSRKGRVSDGKSVSTGPNSSE